jgi:hypothetical protein
MSDDQGKPNEADRPVITTEVRDLACQLTDAEKLERGARMAAAAEQAAALKADASELSKLARSHAREAGRIATVVHAGFEMRAITVEWRANYQERSKTAHRTDTGEALDTVALTAAELQLTLDVVDPPTLAERDGSGAFKPVPISSGRRRRRHHGLAVVPNLPPPPAELTVTEALEHIATATGTQTAHEPPGMITHHEYGEHTPPADPVPIPTADPHHTTAKLEHDHAEV